MSELELVLSLMRGKIRDLGLLKKMVMKSGAREAMEKGMVDAVGEGVDGGDGGCNGGGAGCVDIDGIVSGYL